MEVQRPRATAPPTYQLLWPLELPESEKPRARLPVSSVSPPPTVVPCQVWGTLSLRERIRVERVVVQVIQEVVGNGDRF
jgi:hypothetical protein